MSNNRKTDKQMGYIYTIKYHSSIPKNEQPEEPESKILNMLTMIKASVI